MLDLLYFSLFLLCIVLCCSAVVATVLMAHTLRRWRQDERRYALEDSENVTLMGSVREGWR